MLLDLLIILPLVKNCFKYQRTTIPNILRILLKENKIGSLIRIFWTKTKV